MIEVEHAGPSIMRQCELLAISRSSFYYTPRGENELKCSADFLPKALIPLHGYIDSAQVGLIARVAE